MKRVTNETLKKELKKVNNNLIIAVVCFVLGALCLGIGFYAQNRTPKNTEYLNDIIEGDAENKDNIKANVKLAIKPIQFARLNGTSKKLYFISDGSYNYIISLTENQYKDLTKNDFDKETKTIYGKTKNITSDIKSLAKTYYNKIVDADRKITTDEEFYNALGDIYLDATSEDTGVIILYLIGALSMFVGWILLLVFIVMKVKLNSAFKKISDEELQKIESEIDDKESFNYERAKLILTKNYIISFLNGFRALQYSDIIWIYEYRLRQYGMTTQKSIMVMDKNGKVKPILTLDGLTKKSKIVFDEIAETIVSKNNKILVGYNKENKNKIKEEYNF